MDIHIRNNHEEKPHDIMHLGGYTRLNLRTYVPANLITRRARAFVCIKHARLTDFAEPHSTFGYLLFRPRPETNNPEMWKTALLSLAVALSTAQGTLAGIMSTYQWKLSYLGSFGNRLGVESWDHMLAELMQRNVQTGTCGDKCYVNAGGDQRVLERGGSFVHSSDPCLQYICEVSDISLQ